MKSAKWWTGLAAAACLAAATAASAAFTEKVDGLAWHYRVDGETATIVGASRTSPTIPVATRGSVCTPATLGGYPVTGIESNAFSGCSNLTEVVIADGVTNIGRFAFYKCSSLTNMVIPDTVTGIGSNAFQLASAAIHDTNRIAGVDLVDGWAVGWNAAIAAEPDFTGLRGVADRAFASCQALECVTLPGTVEEIGVQVFAACTNLTAVTVPGSVTGIGSNAFQRCVRLESVQLGNGVARIGEYAFQGCTSLGDVELPDTVVEIGGYAYGSCSALTNVSLGHGVEIVGQNAFENCTQLETIVFPESAKDIHYGVCNGCDNLCWMYLPAGWKEAADHYEELMFPPALHPPAIRRVRVVFGSMHRSGSWEYSLNAKGEATVWDGLPDERGVLAIPSALDGYPVKQIGNLAFRTRDDLTEVIVPSGVEWIGEHAFAACACLVSVSLPESLAGLGQYAFASCPILEVDRLSVPGVVLLDGWVVASEGAAGDLDLESVRGIQHGVFSYNKSITSVKIGGRVKDIGWETFYACTNLATVVIPDSVRSIGLNAFRGCSNLQSLAVGSGLELIRCQTGGGGNNWGGTPDIHIHDLAAWCNTDFCGAAPLLGCRLFLDGAEVTELTVPDGVKRIPDRAFVGCPSLRAVTISDGVEAIGTSAFTNCPALAVVTILGNVELATDNRDLYSHRKAPFQYCTNLQRVVLGGSMTRVPECLFSGFGLFTNDWPGIRTLEIGESVTDIGAGAFAACHRLESLPLGLSVTNIGDEAFRSCKALSTLAIPDSVVAIGDQAFDGCERLASLTVGRGVERIGSSAFNGCTNLARVEIEDLGAWCGIKFGNYVANPLQGSRLFVGGTEVTALTVPAGTPAVCDLAFCGCRSLVSVDIAEGVKSIGRQAFFGCTNLFSVDIADDVEDIGRQAFSECSKLASVTLPPELGHVGQDAFLYCSGLREVHIRDLAAWCGIDFENEWSNPLFRAHRLFLDGTEVTDLAIPGGVREIRPYAFYGCLGLLAADFPAHVERIGGAAFCGCSNLADVAIADGVESIGAAAFKHCVRIGSVSLPASVKGLEASAFGYCTGLTNVAVAGTLTNDWGPYSNPFSYCGALATVTVGDGATRIGDSMFAGCTGLTTLVVSGNVTNDWLALRAPFDNCRSLETVVLAGNMTRVGTNMFKWCTGPMHVTLGEKVSSVAVGAFPWDAYSPCQIRSLTILGTITNGAFPSQAMLGSVAFGERATAIGDSMFAYCSSLADVEIGPGVESIGEQSFAWCTGLESLVIPANVRSIGRSAFLGSGLRHVTVEGNITNDWADYENPFCQCTNLAEVVLGDGVTKIGSCMFYDCSELASVTLGSAVESIGDDAFRGCTGLERLVIPDSVQTVGRDAFYGSGVETLEVPAAWRGTDMLENAQVPAGCSIVYRGGSEPGPAIEWSYEVEDGRATVTGAEPAEGHLEIPAELGGCPVTDIGYSAFGWCEGIVSVSFPDSVTNIGRMAFRDCTGLESVAFGAGLASIGEDAFAGCTGLADVVLPDSVETVGAEAFLECTGLESLVLGEGLADIGYGAFSWCTGLTNVAIPDSVTNLGYSAFSGCSSLECVEIGAGVTDEERLCWAFSWECGGLMRLLVPENHPVWTGVDGVVFSKDGTRLVLFPRGRGGAYEVPAGVTCIAERCFNDCSNLTAVSLPDGLVRIEGSVFSGCSGLVSMEIPDSVESIGAYAFDSCNGMTDVEIGAGVAEIGDRAFQNCDALERFGVAAGNPAYADEGGVLFSKDRRLLIQCPARKGGAYTVPQGVVRIGNSAFANCGALTSVDIADSVESIGGRAFAWCGALERVALGTGVREIGETNDVHWAFVCDGMLTSINVAGGNPAFADRDGVLFSKDFRTLVLCPPGKGGNYRVPDGVEQVGACAFWGNAGLTGVEFPAGLADIGGSAFSGCPGLTEVSVPEGVTNIGDKAFSDCPALASVDLPESLVHLGSIAFGRWDDYQSEFTEELYDTTSVPGVKLVDGWAVYDGYADYPEVLDLSGVRGIADEAFWASWAFRSVILPEGLVSIGAHAFDFTRLESVAIPASVVFIGDGAFGDCQYLEAIGVAEGNAHFAGEDGVLFSKDKKRLLCFPGGRGGDYLVPDGVKEIRDQAFQGCTGLEEVRLPAGIAGIGRWAFDGCYGLETLHVPAAWKTKYVDGIFWSEHAGVPEGCEIAYDAGGGEALPEVTDASEIAGILSAAADARLAGKIATMEDYNGFRTWALAVKGLDGEPAGAEAVLASEHAWASYLLGAETLFENEPVIRIAEVAVGTATDGGKARDGADATLTVRVRVRDDGNIAAVDAAKVANLFIATARLLDWSGDGNLDCEVQAGHSVEDGTMSFTVRIDDKGDGRAFLRLCE